MTEDPVVARGATVVFLLLGTAVLVRAVKAPPKCETTYETTSRSIAKRGRGRYAGS